jgi:hypothetical protein
LTEARYTPGSKRLSARRCGRFWRAAIPANDPLRHQAIQQV